MTAMTPNFPMHIEQGADFDLTFSWYGAGKFMAPIEDIQPGYPTIITVTGHQLNSISPTPLVISGADDVPNLNSSDTQIALATRITDDTFSVDLSTVGDTWKAGTGEITYWHPVDLTDGWTGVANIRKNWYSSTILHSMSTAAGTMILGADGGVRMLITAANTALLKFVGGVYDIDLTKGGIISRVFKGPVTLHTDI